MSKRPPLPALVLLLAAILLSPSCRKKEAVSPPAPPEEGLVRTLTVPGGTLDQVAGTLALIFFDLSRERPDLNEATIRIVVERDFLKGRIDAAYTQNPLLCLARETNLDLARSFEDRQTYRDDPEIRARYLHILESAGDPELLQVFPDHTGPEAGAATRPAH